MSGKPEAAFIKDGFLDRVRDHTRGSAGDCQVDREPDGIHDR
jgi:hypothetical protein